MLVCTRVREPVIPELYGLRIPLLKMSVLHVKWGGEEGVLGEVGCSGLWGGFLGGNIPLIRDGFISFPRWTWPWILHRGESTKGPWLVESSRGADALRVVGPLG